MYQTLLIKGNDGMLFEGPLSDQPTKLLFVMKEPNGEKLNCFWLKKVVSGEERGGLATRYFNVLGAFAKTFLEENDHKPALKQCAYINLYPFDGGSAATGGGYVKLMNLWKKKKVEGDIADREKILSNRLQIIENALNSGISVAAHYEIANMLVINNTFKDKFKKTEDYADNKYHIASYQYGDKAKLYAVPHPTRRMNYDTLAKILGISSIYPENE